MDGDESYGETGDGVMGEGSDGVNVGGFSAIIAYSYECQAKVEADDGEERNGLERDERS